MAGNPCVDGDDIIAALLVRLPALVTIDGEKVTPAHRQAARDLFRSEVLSAFKDSAGALKDVVAAFETDTVAFDEATAAAEADESGETAKPEYILFLRFYDSSLKF